MSGLFAIAAREIRDRRAVFGLGLALGFAPLTAPLFRAEITDALSIIVTVSLPLLLGVAVGSSVLGHELTDCRLSFFLSRPVPWWSVWGGKFVAAASLSVGAAALATLPLLASRSALSAALPALRHPLLPLTVVALIGATHFAGVAWRARSAWLIVDLACLVAAFLAFREVAGRLLRWGVLLSSGWQYVAIVGGIAFALTVASAAQVAVGRADLHRGHLAQSMVVWGLTLPILGGFWAYAVRLDAARPADLRVAVYGAAASQGNWLWVTGPHRDGVFPVLLIDAVSGASLHAWPWAGSVAFSADGTRAAWIAGMPDADAAELHVAHLDGAQPSFGSQRLGGHFGSEVVLSPSGRRAALADFERLRLVVDVPSGITSPLVDVPFRDLKALLFVTDDRLRTYRADPMGGRVLISDLAFQKHPVSSGGEPESRPAFRTEAIGGFEAGPGGRFWIGPGAERLLVASSDAGAGWQLSLRGADGKALAELASLGPRTDLDAAFLSDGRIAVVVAGTDTRLSIFGSSGQEQARVVVDPRRQGASLAWEPRPGLVAVHLEAANALVHVDTVAGKILRRDTEVRPLSWRRRPAPTGPAGRFFVDAHGNVVALDAETGARTTVLRTGGQ